MWVRHGIIPHISSFCIRIIQMSHCKWTCCAKSCWETGSASVHWCKGVSRTKQNDFCFLFWKLRPLCWLHLSHGGKWIARSSLSKWKWLMLVTSKKVLSAELMKNIKSRMKSSPFFSLSVTYLEYYNGGFQEHHFYHPVLIIIVIYIY